MSNQKQNKKVKVIVYHTSYGCDTGCCGHSVKIDDEEFGFEFSHPYGSDNKQWAVDFAQNAVANKYGQDHIADLDWENCLIVND